MKTEPVDVVDLAGATRVADMIVCEHCAGKTFFLFQVRHMVGEHIHLQCAACGVSYCDGACATDAGEPEREADPGSNDANCAHEWVHTGTNYGGDDERFHGDGRVYCSKCGADGDA
jgi:hypothetical protein